MNIMPKILIAVTIVTIGLSCPLAATAGQQLTDYDEVHLIFMRSEEKLARDVYLELYDLFKLEVFYTIADKAEQTHTDTMLRMVEQFTSFDDPEPYADDPDFNGLFENPQFAGYFNNKYTVLIGEAVTPLDALYVGAKIEELDMKDINYCNEVVYIVNEWDLPPPDLCGLTTVADVKPLDQSLRNLLSGSKNHLCAFVRNIRAIDRDGCYYPQILSISEVLEIFSDEGYCPDLESYVCEPEP